MKVKKVTGGNKWKQELGKLTGMNIGFKVGILDGATYENGTSVAYVAYLNEYGYPVKGHNPPRPFMGRTIELNGKKWMAIIKHNLKGKRFSRDAALKAYNAAGQVARTDMMNTIKEWPDSDPRGNKESTIKRKEKRGRSGKNLEAIDPNKALMDTSHMLKSINFEVIG